MELLTRVKGTIRHRRGFYNCQLAGFTLMSTALTIVEHPSSLALDWVNSLYSWSIPAQFWIAYFFICGWLLAWQMHPSSWLFFLLTSPILLYSCVSWIYFFTNSRVASTPAFLMLILFICLQVTHARLEVFYTWMKSFEAS